MSNWIGLSVISAEHSGLSEVSRDLILGRWVDDSPGCISDFSCFHYLSNPRAAREETRSRATPIVFGTVLPWALSAFSANV